MQFAVFFQTLGTGPYSAHLSRVPANVALAYLVLCRETRPHDLGPPYLALVFSEEVICQILMFGVRVVKN